MEQLEAESPPSSSPQIHAELVHIGRKSLDSYGTPSAEGHFELQSAMHGEDERATAWDGQNSTQCRDGTAHRTEKVSPIWGLATVVHSSGDGCPALENLQDCLKVSVVGNRTSCHGPVRAAS